MGFIPLPLALLVRCSFMGICTDPVHILMFAELTLVFTSCSVDQSSEQLCEDPGLTLLYVCAALLFGVNPFHQCHQIKSVT